MTAGAPPSTLRTSTCAAFSARASAATASALARTSSARAGSALTLGMRTSFSRSARTDGRIASTAAAMSFIASTLDAHADNAAYVAQRQTGADQQRRGSEKRQPAGRCPGVRQRRAGVITGSRLVRATVTGARGIVVVGPVVGMVVAGFLGVVRLLRLAGLVTVTGFVRLVRPVTRTDPDQDRIMVAGPEH